MKADEVARVANTTQDAMLKRPLVPTDIHCYAHLREC
jgi:hypothetical protein